MRYRTPLLQAIHRGAEELKSLDLMDAPTFHRFEAGCVLPDDSFAPEYLKQLRQREGVSQAVLATYLRVATATVSQWERGERTPDGPVRKLLELIENHGLAYIR